MKVKSEGWKALVDENSSYLDRFNHLLAVLSSEQFLKKQGLGNEVPFFICPYLPEDNDIYKLVSQITNQLKNNGVEVLNINLYDLSIELIKKRGLLERIFERESSLEKELLKETLQGVLDPENHLVPAIVEKMNQGHFDILFLTGAGEVYPYIRTHSVLENLQIAASEKPVILFFPGKYSFSLEKGAYLSLFGRLHDDRYYRAYNLYFYEI